MHTKLVTPIILGLLAAGCSSTTTETVAEAASSTIETADPGTETTAATTVPTTFSAETTVGTASNSASSTTSVDSGIEGELIDYGPAEGFELAVVGVAPDDTLNFRSGPQADQAIVASAAPLDFSRSIVTTGETWLGPNSAWWGVTIDGKAAWANQSYLGILGASYDLTAEVMGSIDSATADSMADLATSVAQTRASTDPKSRLVMVSGVDELPGDQAAIVIDVIGLGDDAAVGERLTILADVTYTDDSEVASVSLAGVEGTTICGRGESAGLCL